MRKAFFITSFCILLLMPSRMQAGMIGGLAGAWLRAPVGADARARGGATTASPRHLFSWHNPALLVSGKENRLTLGGSFRSLGRTEGVGAYEFRVPPRVGMGVSVLYRGDPFLDNLRDWEGDELEDGKFTTLTFKVGLAYFVSRTLYIGANVSAFYQSMPVGYDGKALINESAMSMGGFDVGARIEASDNICIGLVVKNLGAGVTVNTVGDYDYDIPLEAQFPPAAVAAAQVTTRLLGKPFIWTCDLSGYVFDGKFTKLDHPSAILDNGVEWQYWTQFHLRAGVKDIELNGDIIHNGQRYRDLFSCAVTAGFYLDLSSLVKGLSLNYALATDKVWAGVENVADFMYVF